VERIVDRSLPLGAVALKVGPVSISWQAFAQYQLGDGRNIGSIANSLRQAHGVLRTC
jgi:hypothetical protein